jgi:hypothetical protein
LKQFVCKCRGEKAKITLCGYLAHAIPEKVIENPPVIVVTSTMVIGPQYKGKFYLIFM